VKLAFEGTRRNVLALGFGKYGLEFVRRGRRADSLRSLRVMLCTMLSADAPDLSTLSQADLFSLYRAILSELKGCGVIRTENAPAGDYAEYLVAAAVSGQLAPNSEKSWDAFGRNGEKLQLKARVVSDPIQPGQLQLSPFRSFEFDFAVIVFLSAADYVVCRASKVPRHVVELLRFIGST
jgi:hypothetical protein